MKELRPDDLQMLREKYDALLELRQARSIAIHEGLHSFSPEDSLRRREHMKRLAARFPGALREMEVLSESALRHRRDAIDAVLSGANSTLPFWMKAVSLFHPALRAVLTSRMKVTMQDRKALPRPSEMAWRLVAESLGTTPGQAERLVFPKK